MSPLSALPVIAAASMFSWKPPGAVTLNAFSTPSAREHALLDRLLAAEAAQQPVRHAADRGAEVGRRADLDHAGAVPAAAGRELLELEQQHGLADAAQARVDEAAALVAGLEPREQGVEALDVAVAPARGTAASSPRPRCRGSWPASAPRASVAGVWVDVAISPHKSTRRRAESVRRCGDFATRATLGPHSPPLPDGDRVGLARRCPRLAHARRSRRRFGSAPRGDRAAARGGRVRGRRAGRDGRGADAEGSLLQPGRRARRHPHAADAHRRGPAGGARDPRAAPGTGVLVLSQYVEAEYALDLLAEQRRGRRLPAQGPRLGRRPSSPAPCAAWARAARRSTPRSSRSSSGGGARTTRSQT